MEEKAIPHVTFAPRLGKACIYHEDKIWCLSIISDRKQKIIPIEDKLHLLVQHFNTDRKAFNRPVRDSYPFPFIKELLIRLHKQENALGLLRKICDPKVHLERRMEMANHLHRFNTRGIVSHAEKHCTFSFVIQSQEEQKIFEAIPKRFQNIIGTKK